MIDEQTFREALGAIFFALLADRDCVSARASADVLREAVEGGAVQDPAAGVTALYRQECSDSRVAFLMLSESDLGELARMLQQHTPLYQLSNMQVRAALELMQQRGYKITKRNED